MHFTLVQLSSACSGFMATPSYIVFEYDNVITVGQSRLFQVESVNGAPHESGRDQALSIMSLVFSPIACKGFISCLVFSDDSG